MSPDELPARVAELEAQCSALLVEREWRDREARLLRALNDIELSTAAWLIAALLIRLSYGRGRVSVLVPFQQRLGELCGVGKTHVKAALTELIDRAKILQVYPDGERYEILPDTSKWRPRARCQFGPAHAAGIEREIDDRNSGEQRDLGELEMTFQPDPIITAAGEADRDDAFQSPASCPPTPGAPGGQPVHPPGIIRNATGGVALSQMLRRQLATNAAQKVTDLVTSGDPSTGSKRVQEEKVTKSVTFPVPPSTPAAEKLPNSELLPGPRARASDDRSSGSSESSGSSRRQLSSVSSGEADEADDVVADGRAKAKADDPLLGDLRRAVGEAHFAGWEDYWRYAIGHSRAAAAHALAALRLHPGPDHPGRYARKCFVKDCRDRGRPFREIALKPQREGCTGK